METEVGQLLAEWNDGDESARDRLVPLVYGELRRLAGGFLQRERAGHTLQPTALVNEAFLRFFQQRNVPAEGRQQFFGLIAQLMRRVLVDHARKKNAAKRGGPQTCITLDEQLEHAVSSNLAVLDVDRALEKLEAMDSRQARIVELRVFGGFEVTDVATALEISPATVKREWRSARAWLHRELHL